MHGEGMGLWKLKTQGQSCSFRGEAVIHTSEGVVLNEASRSKYKAGYGLVNLDVRLNPNNHAHQSNRTYLSHIPRSVCSPRIRLVQNGLEFECCTLNLKERGKSRLDTETCAMHGASQNRRRGRALSFHQEA